MSKEKTHPEPKVALPKKGDQVFYHHSVPMPNGGYKRSTRVAIVCGEAPAASNFQVKDMAMFLFILPSVEGGNWETRTAMYSPEPKDGRWSYAENGDVKA